MLRGIVAFVCLLVVWPAQAFDAWIEIGAHQTGVKYEYDPQIKQLRVDRFLPNSLRYPVNYGFIPHTRSSDGDPLDVLVLAPYSLQPGSVITVRSIGVLLMRDERGDDPKILAVPIDDVDPTYHAYHEFSDIPQQLRTAIGTFFEHYKQATPHRWSVVGHWQSAKQAQQILLASQQRYLRAKTS